MGNLLTEKSERGAAALWCAHAALLGVSGIVYGSWQRCITASCQLACDVLPLVYGLDANGQKRPALNKTSQFFTSNALRLQQGLSVPAAVFYAYSGLAHHRPFEAVSGFALLTGFMINLTIQQKIPVVDNNYHRTVYFSGDSWFASFGNKAYYALDVVNAVLVSASMPAIEVFYDFYRNPVATIRCLPAEIYHNPRRFSVPLLQSGSCLTVFSGIAKLDPFQTTAGICRIFGNDRLRLARANSAARS